MRNMEEIISKTNGNGNTSLLDHTKMVINMAVSIAKNSINDLSDRLLKKIAVAAAIHDLGKCSTSFQDYIKKRNEEDDEGLEEAQDKQNFYHHNTLSWAFAYACTYGLNSKGNYPLRSAILYHHTVRDNGDLTADQIIADLLKTDRPGYDAMVDVYNELMAYIDDRFSLGVTNNPDFKVKEIFDEGDLTSSIKVKDELLYPYHGIGKDVDIETAYETLITRTIITYADRTVSSGIYDNERILNNDSDYIDEIFKCRIQTHYDRQPDYSAYDQERLKMQLDLVSKISSGPDGVWGVSASAGFGKTLMGLMRHFVVGKKTKWVTPRTVIADSTYDSIVKELEKMNMSDQVKVGLYYGGELKKANFSGSGNIDQLTQCDILVLVIDSFLSEYSKNNMAPMLVDTCFGEVIFDEYHEFICEQPLFAAFIYLLYTRKEHTNTKTLLLSASGFDLSGLLGGPQRLYTEKPPIYGGETKMFIQVKEADEISKLAPSLLDNSFTVMPTVRTAQNAYRRENGVITKLIHSRYIPEDRESRTSELYSMYGKEVSNGIKKLPVIGTKIIGVGLDISAKSVGYYMPTPEDTIQTGCGRAARFKEYDCVDFTVFKTKDRNIVKFINSLYPKKLRDKWYDELLKLHNLTITKEDMYRLRDDFYHKNHTTLNEYLMDTLDKSAESLSSINYKSGNHSTRKEYDTCARVFTYRGKSSSLYVTLKDENGEYMKPFVCDAVVLNDESSCGEDNKARFDFMTDRNNGFNFPCDSEMKYAYKIKRNDSKNPQNEATVANCYGLAWRADRPMLLLNHKYDKEIGLYSLEEDEDSFE